MSDDDLGVPTTPGPMLRFECSTCLVRYPTGAYSCTGGWPRYDPKKPPLERYAPVHPATPVRRFHA